MVLSIYSILIAGDEL